MKYILSLLLITSGCIYGQKVIENPLYREGVNLKLQNYRIVSGLLHVVYATRKKDSLVINLMVREGEIVAYSHDQHLTIFLNLERNNSIFIERPHDDKVSSAWFEFRDSYLEEKYDASLTVHVDYLFLFFKSKKIITEVYDGEKWRPIELKEYDTVKCIVQHWGEFKRSFFTEGGNESSVLALSKAWVVRKIVVRNNMQKMEAGIIIYPQEDYKEWNEYYPIKFLLQNKRTPVENVWKSNNEPTYILKDW